MKKILHYVALALAFSACSKPTPPVRPDAGASRKAEIESWLRGIDADPKSGMNRVPPKRDARTGAVLSMRRFSEEAISSGVFVTEKDKVRQNLCTTVGGAEVCLGELLPGRSPFEDNDRAENLTDNGYDASFVRTLDAMDERGLTSATLAESPWSDYYWPLFMGVLGVRYADESFPAVAEWELNQSYATEPGRTVADVLATGDASSIDLLSPSEKYDLLVGDAQGTLTARMWEQGRAYFDEYGNVEYWMGICHGWAPASYMNPRPRHPVTLKAADGVTELKFYPSDIKGLASLLWAKNSPSVRLIGGRCDDKEPELDGAGRMVSPDCLDTNPGTWHLAVVNQLGVSRRGLIMDATFDYEVWNQPLYSYRYSYFNPGTLEAVDRLEDARVAAEDLPNDPFKDHRSPDTAWVVGVAMDVTYIAETDPTHEPSFDSPEYDKHVEVRYVYDLELNAEGEIVGGEWRGNVHPDFLWTPAPDSYPDSPGDALATDPWDGVGPAPRSWRRAGRQAASYGMPLGKIVQLLTTLSRL